MECSDYIEEIKKSLKNKDSAHISKLNYMIKSQFAAQLDDDGLESFYQSAIESILNEKWLAKVRISDISTFELGISDVFSTAKVYLNKNIKGIYLEYFFDGQDECSADVFMCNEYDDNDDDWATIWEENGFIEGPLLINYLGYDNDCELESLEKILAWEYADAMLLAAVMRSWRKSDISCIPFAFSGHDGGYMIRLTVPEYSAEKPVRG